MGLHELWAAPPCTGAANIDLEGVYHSPLGAVEADRGTDRGADRGAGRPWYGSAGVLKQWVEVLGVPTQAPATP